MLVVGFMSVAFLTLIERKLLGLSQIRLGPNKTSISGLLQPLIDGLKLLSKETVGVIRRNWVFYIRRPSLLLILFILVWVFTIPWKRAVILSKYNVLLFLSILGITTYCIILTGWRTMRSFSKLGRSRGLVQRLSYEICLFLLFFVFIQRAKRFVLKIEEPIEVELFFIWAFIWVFISLMESNRAPFDLLEGERELIRGFNIEISRGLFVFLFLREYGFILASSLIFRAVLTGETSSVVVFSIFYCLIIFMRSCFPRVRYDIIIGFTWKCVLPLAILYLVFVVFFF